jgi:hypothetical protein
MSETGTIVRFDVHGFRGLHELLFVPDDALQAMRDGRYTGIPRAVYGPITDGQTALRWPMQAVRGSREDVVRIIEDGWPAATKNLAAVKLNDLPIEDSHTFPQPRPSQADLGWSLLAALAINRAVGRVAAADQVATLRRLWADGDGRRAQLVGGAS